MLSKTHLALGIGVALYFLPHVKNELVFIPIVLIATLLPDIDSAFSLLGRSKFSRPVQWMTKHRGVLHTYTVCIVLSILFAFHSPLIALPFFLGYSFHLVLDSFTPQGIQPFWPLKYRSAGRIQTGGRVESAIYAVFVIVDAALLIKLFF